MGKIDLKLHHNKQSKSKFQNKLGVIINVSSLRAWELKQKNGDLETDPEAAEPCLKSKHITQAVVAHTFNPST